MNAHAHADTLLSTRQFFKEVDVIFQKTNTEYGYSEGDLLLCDGEVVRSTGCTDGSCNPYVVSVADGSVYLYEEGNTKLLYNPVHDIIKEHTERQAVEAVVRYPLPYLKTGDKVISEKDLKDVPKHPNRDLDGVTVYDILHPCMKLYPSADYNKLGANRFGMKPIDSEYCWVPHRVHINDDGFVNIETLVDTQLLLYKHLTRVLEGMVPGFKHVWQYLQGLERPDEDNEYDRGYESNVSEVLALEDFTTNTETLPSSLQFFMKVVNIEIDSCASYDGVWHVEGMPQEHIVATGIYYLDSPAKGAELIFKRQFHSCEHTYLFSNIGQSDSASFHEIFNNMYMPLGTIKTTPGSVLVFPNTHAHKVQPFTNDEEETIFRPFVVFFMVDPEITLPDFSTVDPAKVVSTFDDPELVELKKNMQRRMYCKESMNPREMNFCEH